jgi:hypothetical protein
LNVGTFGKKQRALSSLGGSFVGCNLSLKCTPGVIGKERADEGEDRECPIGPQFWRESFFPKLTRLIIGFCLFGLGLRLTAGFEPWCTWRWKRFLAVCGLVISFLGSLLLVGPILWQWGLRRKAPNCQYQKLSDEQGEAFSHPLLNLSVSRIGGVLIYCHHYFAPLK